MMFKDIPAGRYKCRITDWALEEVEKFDNALAVKIQLDIMMPGEPSSPVVGWWSSFLKTKEGKANEKAIKTLVSCGFSSHDIYSLQTSGNALDVNKEMEVTISKDDQGRSKADWLNSGERGLKKQLVTKRKDLALEAAFNQALGAKKAKVKNFAPQATKPVDDEIPF